MTEETNSHGNATPEIGEEPTHERTSTSENDADGRLSASRRDLLRGSASFALSPLLGSVSGVTDVDLDAVTWTAQNRTVKGRRIDGSNRAAFTNPEKWDAAHATNTQLQYLGAQWERFGNPNSDADSDWHLKHTFALTSYSLALRPWVVKQEGSSLSADGMDWVPAVRMDDLPANVNDYLKKKHGDPGFGDSLHRVKEKVDVKTDFEIKTLQTSLRDEESRQSQDSTDYTTMVDIDGPPIVDNVALSVRRDSDLYGFAEPESFWKAAFGKDESYLPETGNKLASTPPVVPVLETLSNHVENPMDVQYRDVVERAPNDRVDQVLGQRKQANERGRLYNWFESSAGLALGIAGLAAGGALVTGAGLALAVWGWLDATQTALKSSPDEAPPYKGVHQPYSYKWDHPAAASFVMFDAYVDPNEQFTLGSKPQFTVRVRHEESGNSPSLDEESIWVVAFDEQIPDGPNDDYDPASIHNARILPWEKAKEHLSDESSDDHKISYDKDGELVTFRPQPTFSIEPAEPTAGEDEVTFDPSNTMIGGAPIAKYEWKLWKLATYADEADANPKCQRRRVRLSDAGGERNIFETEDEGVQTVEFSQPGRYEMEFTVWDEQDSTGGYSVRKFFDVEPKTTEPLELTVRIPNTPPTVRVGEPVTFGARVTDEPAITDVVGNAFVGDLDDVKLYEWDVLQNYEQFRPTDGFTPAYDKQGKWLDPTYTHEFEEPGQYEVFVKVTDPLSGADGQYSVPVTVVEEPSYELTAEDDPDPFELVTDSITDTLTVRLTGSESTDFDLYASLDGRIPERFDYDRKSRNPGSDEHITFEEDEAGADPNIKLIVDAYRGKGNYHLTVESKSEAHLEYMGGDETPQDDDV